jgi:hypothetical protein
MTLRKNAPTLVSEEPMADQTHVESVLLPDGARLQIEVRAPSGYQEVGALDALSFDSVTKALESLGTSLSGALARMKPDKAAIEFGMEIAVEAGKLTTLICQGKTTANFTVKLEWEKPR